MDENLDFVVYQQRVNEFLTNSEFETTNQNDILALPRVFRFVHKNLKKINRDLLMSDVLPVLHHSLRLAAQAENAMDIGIYICALFDLNNGNDKDVQCCLQILYQILKTVSPEEGQYLHIGDNIFIKLIEVLLDNQAPYNNANILACLKLYVNKFNAVQIITKLWLPIKAYLSSDQHQITKNSAVLQVFIHFFDEFSRHISDFKQSLEIDPLVQQLLNSGRQEERKCAFFLLKKDHPEFEIQPAMRLGATQEQEFKRKSNFWRICISCFENLEETQYCLILPSLQKLRNLRISDLREQIWLDVLYRQILRHKNIFVRRWIIEYVLGKLTFFSMTQETQLQFMRALNDTALYNIEEYMLPEENIGRFLVCEKSSFLLSLSQIDWKAIPLHYWLSKLLLHWQAVNEVDITRSALISLATKIQTMRKAVLRRENIRLFEKLFCCIIKDMSLTAYIQLIGALYNETDFYEDVNIFTEKLKDCQEHGLDGNYIFTKRFCNILMNRKDLQRNGISNAFFDFVRTAIVKIQEKGWTPGYLRFIFLFYLDIFYVKSFFQAYYNIDASFCLPEMSPKVIYENFRQRLAITDEEQCLLKQRITDFYAQNVIKSFSDLRKYNVNLEELLIDGSTITLCSLMEVLAEHREPVGRIVLDCFVEHLRKHLNNDSVCQFVCDNLMKYCWTNLRSSELVHWGTILINLDLENMRLCHAVTSYVDGPLFPDDFLIKGSLIGNAKTGDARIMEAYECKVLKNQISLYFIRMKYIQRIDKIHDKERKAGLLLTLCKMLRHLNLQTLERPYNANDVEHRMLIRIFCVIFAILRDTKVTSSVALPELWAFLMEHNNQENVTILCEIAITTILSWEDILAKVQEQLRTERCTSSQELSMVALLYRSFKLKCNFSNATEMEKVLFLLWSLRVSSDSQVRLNAHNSISALLDGFQKEHSKNRKKLSILEPFIKLINAIKRRPDNAQMTAFKRDIRFMDLKIEDAFEKVMAFTKVPYDEYNFIGYPPPKFENLQIENNRNSMLMNGYFDERKRYSAVIDFMPSADLVTYPDHEENSFFVVGSLIDKVSVLDAVAHTCNVLDIENLVIDSKALIEKTDFKTLRLTAAKSLCLIEVQHSELTEFILKKKTEGFKIVAAEQTANSCNFENFSFPKRCVLLLGHEKEGIPPNLLGHLDFAVRVPQSSVKQPFSNHTANTLLMYEYCKQRLVQ